jgi:hypothetical protein
LHRAYLQLLVTREVGSACLAPSEEELADHCKGLSWEGVLEVLSSRRLEAEFLKEVLKEPVPHPEMRLFFEEVRRRGVRNSQGPCGSCSRKRVARNAGFETQCRREEGRPEGRPSVCLKL